MLCTMAVALTGGILMGLYWDSSVAIGGKQYSLPLLGIFAGFAACASLSNVTHFTFVSLYSAENTTAMAVGFSLGSMTAGLLAILQGTVWTTLSVRTYFLILTTLFLPALWLMWGADVTAISSADCEDGR
jgi:hypothetical protein